jgi:fumarate reductase (CoM/CoB) subunit A
MATVPSVELKIVTAVAPSGDRVTALDCDVLIIGAGLAGLRAALSARRAGAKVLLVGKRQVGRSGSSVNTTGGYAAVLPDLNAADDEKLHFADTIVGGGFVNDRRLVAVLVRESPIRLRELLQLGVQFRGENGAPHLSPSGDHSQQRVIVPKNMRGLDLTLPLREAVEEAGVEVLEDCVVLDLLRKDGQVTGAVAVHRLRNEGYVLGAGAVVLAAGGAGQLFSTTSNPVDVCGSGYALALRAGARLRDMEFIQFYPWRLIRPFKSIRVPIQPSTFALGGRLYNSRGERFMECYDPVRLESTTRDISARGIAEQINNGLAVEGGVVLDVSKVPDDQFRFENPKVVDLLARKSLDYRTIQLIVAPEAHYFMGGVDIDENGRANLPGLFAAGENAGGVHGGNRLNSNSVPDTQVFGHRAGAAAAAYARAHPSSNSSNEHEAARLSTLLSDSGSAEPSPELEAERERLREIMTRTVGLVRDRAGLEQAVAAAREVAGKATKIKQRGHADLIALADLKDMCATAQACAESALCRTESRAAHFRSDFPQSDPAWLCTVLYDDHGTSLRRIETAADEDELQSLRATHAAAAEGREHVE